MKRQYLIPIDPVDLGIQRYLILLHKYGIDVYLLADEALKGILNNGVDYCFNVVNCLSDAICQEFQADPVGSSTSLAMAIDKEMQKYHEIVISACDVLVSHMRPYIQMIESKEDQAGTDLKRMSWRIGQPHGGDIIIEVST